MFSWIKKLVSLAFVLLAICLILNLNIGGRPSRERALEIWRSPGVQKVYTVVRDRILAVIHKDISVEDVFKGSTEPAKSNSSTSGLKEESKVIHLEKLDEQDRKALEKILEKASK